MDGFELTEMGDAVPEFTLKEIIVMQRLLKDVGGKSMSQEFCQELVDRFSQSKHRTGKRAIKWEQVQSWFQEKQKQRAAEVSTPLVAIKEINPPSDWALTINVPEGPKNSKAERVAGLTELAFEAKSFKDFAWYDVASFLSYRVVHTGELEVRVRFSGFGYDQDEWVNVKRGVRERSIPLVPSECHRVKVGDLVLCFRETDVRAIYCDAYIVEIAKTTHDIQTCTCDFLVRYTYDDAEIKVPLSSLCSRPS